jgi:hypothetical protein
MRTVGYGCAVMAVALTILSIWMAGAGVEAGMGPMLLALTLLLGAVLTLGAGESKV